MLRNEGERLYNQFTNTRVLNFEADEWEGFLGDNGLTLGTVNMATYLRIEFFGEKV